MFMYPCRNQLLTITECLQKVHAYERSTVSKAFDLFYNLESIIGRHLYFYHAIINDIKAKLTFIYFFAEQKMDACGASDHVFAKHQ